MRRDPRPLAAFLVGPILAVGFSAASAAPVQPERQPQKVALDAAESSASGPDAEEPADCSRLRKRLWIAGEGWIVRKVTICR